MPTGPQKSIFIREARPADLSRIAKTARLAWATAYADVLSPATIRSVLQQEFCAKDVLRRLNDPDRWFFLAVWDDAVVGYAECRGRSAVEPADLDQLYIRPDWQRQGIGSRLLAVSAATLCRHGHTTLRVMVAKANQPAIHFYNQHAFATSRECVTLIGNQMVEVVEMRVLLQQWGNDDDGAGC